MSSSGIRGKSHHDGFLSSPRSSNHMRVKQSEERRKRAGYLYIKPKVGAQYQAKVPRYQPPVTPASNKSNDIEESSSSALDRMDDTTFRIENWKGDRRSKEYRELKKIHSEALNSQNNTTQQIYAPVRNPLCTHKPTPIQRDDKINNLDEDDLPLSTASSSFQSHTHDDFLLFARNLFLQSTDLRKSHPRQMQSRKTQSRSFDVNVASNPWLGTIRSNHYGLNRKNSHVTKHKNGLKRKIDETEEGHESNVSSISASAIDNGRKQKQSINSDALCGLEQDESMLEFLQKHNGDESRAKVSLMIHLSKGIAKKRRKKLKRQSGSPSIEDKNQEEDKQPPQSQHESKSRKNFTMKTHPNMLGDLRSPSSKRNYEYHSVQPSCETDESSTDSDSEIEKRESYGEGYLSSKARWKLFLSQSNQTIKSTISTKSKSKRPRLSKVSSLLNTCLTLDPPQFSISKESTLGKINRNRSALFEIYTLGRDHLANLLDCAHDSDCSGVEMDQLKSSIQAVDAICPVTLDEVQVIRSCMKEVAKWEKRVSDATRNNNLSQNEPKESIEIIQRNDLPMMEKLMNETDNLFFYSKSMAQFEEKVERAKSLKKRILEWTQASKIEKTESIKFIAALVKEANKVGIMFPEIYALNDIHKKAEDWAEHAVRAIRYRISLVELLQVIDEGEKLPLNVTDQLEKLRSKAEGAHEWIQQFQEKVPCPFIPKIDDPSKMVPDNITWLDRIRQMLNADDKDDFKKLLNLAVEGSRIPVDMEALRFLNLEMEARNWSIEAKRLLSTTGRCAKIDEFYAHVAKGRPIRDKAPKGPPNGKGWVLQHEKELKDTVKAADEWIKKYESCIEKNYDVKDDESIKPCSTSIEELRKMVKEGKQSPVNLGLAFGKVSKILASAEKWLNDYRHVLFACGNKAAKGLGDKDYSEQKNFPVTLSELNAALTAASDLPIDLVDVIDLRRTVDKVEKWSDQAALIVPKKQTKRNTRGKCAKVGVVQTKYSLQELISLIEQANSLPKDIDEDLERLKTQLSDVQSWRLQAQCELRGIVTGFNILCAEREAFIAKEASKIFPDLLADNGSQFDHTPTKVVKVEISAQKVDMKVNKLVSILLDSTKSIPIYTIEEKLAVFLTEVLTWCSKSASVTPDAVLGKAVLEQLSVFIKEGDELMARDVNTSDINADDVNSLLLDVRKSWTSVVKKEQNRLKNLEQRGHDFNEWIKKVEILLSSSEKVSLSELQSFCQESNKYPTSIELVRKIRKKGKLATNWVNEAKEILDQSLKISMDVVKKKIAKGDALGLNCVEMKALRGHVRKSKAWAMKVKKCNLEEGRTHIVDIKKLIAEHNDRSFLVSMPEELKTLKLAIRGYCLCRNPYEGFMIGCDGCEEWYHGLCVGISEVQADRCEKYLCIRCCISQNYKDSTNEAMQILRKWKNRNELIKSRGHNQKNFYKRMKKAESDKSKWSAEIDTCTLNLSKLQNQSLQCERKEKNESPTIQGDQLQHTFNMQHNDAYSEGGPSKVQKLNEELEGAIKKVQSKKEGATASLAHTLRRLELLGKEKNTQMIQIEREDKVCDLLHGWFMKAGKLVLVPSSNSQAQSSRPNSDGTISNAMNDLVQEATLSKISDITDVMSLINIFKCLAWCLKALEVLAKKPLQSEIELLLLLSSSIKLPNERGIKFLRSMLQRTTSWQSKVRNALKPIAGETKPFNLIHLNELAAAARNIPMITSEEARLLSTIEDQGTRHCYCGGPGDGTFMLNCDKCERWFHGVCVKLDQCTAASIVSWECPTCASKNNQNKSVENNTPESGVGTIEKNAPEIPHSFGAIYGQSNDVCIQIKQEDHHPWNDVSKYAPDAKKLWPPVGLLGSESANEAVGSDYGGSDHFDMELTTEIQASALHQHQCRPHAEVTVPKAPSEENVHMKAAQSVVQHSQNFHYDTQHHDFIPENVTNTVQSYSYP